MQNLQAKIKVWTLPELSKTDESKEERENYINWILVYFFGPKKL
jgi:hypothetical protein